MSDFDRRQPSDPDAARTSDDRATTTVRTAQDAIVLTVTGEIDMATAPALEQAVRQAFAQRPKILVIDLDGVEFLSSAGIAVLMQAHRSAEEVALRVVATKRIVLRPLELTGLADDLAIRPSVEAAMAG